jgi:glycosyltransferase involved in cell wall biosynthesis
VTRGDFERRTALPGPRIVLTGHMSFTPNHHAALHLIDRVLPRVRQTVPHVACDVVGADPRPELMARHDGRRVTVTGWVPDLRPWIAEATVYACPMLLGAGIKNKLLEAMAMGKAIVSTARGADGIEVHDGEHLLFAEDENEFAARIVELLCAPAQRHTLGTAARALAIERYSWDAAARAYERLYEQLMRQAQAPAAARRPAATATGAGAA